MPFRNPARASRGSHEDKGWPLLITLSNFNPLPDLKPNRQTLGNLVGGPSNDTLHDCKMSKLGQRPDTPRFHATRVVRPPTPSHLLCASQVAQLLRLLFAGVRLDYAVAPRCCMGRWADKTNAEASSVPLDVSVA